MLQIKPRCATLYQCLSLDNTIGILNWNRKEIKDTDMLTRKILIMNGSFHKASYISRLHADKKKGGRGLQCMEDLHGSRIIGLTDHRREGIMRLDTEFQRRLNALRQHGGETEKVKKEQKRKWIEKVIHDYLQKNVNDYDFIDTKVRNEWLEFQLLSPLEGYPAAIVELRN